MRHPLGEHHTLYSVRVQSVIHRGMVHNPVEYENGTKGNKTGLSEQYLFL